MHKFLISGGGTGGHIFPAIAIADAIKLQCPDADILFVGAKGKMEMEKVPQAGYKIIGLNIAGFQRKLAFKNLVFPFKLAHSLMKAVYIIRSFKPDVAIGVGGYASGPTLKIANTFGIPTVLQEQNSYAGVTNRILAPKAALICVAYPNMERFFPKEKIRMTGNPIRHEILKNIVDKINAKQRLGFDQNKKTIAILGGSLGARTINEAVASNADLLLSLNISIVWQVGKLYFEEFKNHPLASNANIKILAFIEDIHLVYSAADLVICRAGALTISELAALGKASVLIPSPNVAEDHQTANAKALSDHDAAILLKDSDAKSELGKVIQNLLSNDTKLSSLSSNILEFGFANAADDIAHAILNLKKSVA
ncbi:MAG: undecaprenyldiphospho-muramoylpentapeptide beta-N-acetylglucosaminyltransferase [Lewinellaceae bacterium]|nr:undecaprenyldiphospho-muramoylpentapeptide beta-N-acetylglucosaminyltransferase [Lewinellaceae bacterium]